MVQASLAEEVLVSMRSSLSPTVRGDTAALAYAHKTVRNPAEQYSVRGIKFSDYRVWRMDIQDLEIQPPRRRPAGKRFAQRQSGNHRTKPPLRPLSAESLPDVEVTRINLNDGTVEEMQRISRILVQYHPRLHPDGMTPRIFSTISRKLTESTRSDESRMRKK